MISSMRLRLRLWLRRDKTVRCAGNNRSRLSLPGRTRSQDWPLPRTSESRPTSFTPRRRRLCHSLLCRGRRRPFEATARSTPRARDADVASRKSTRQSSRGTRCRRSASAPPVRIDSTLQRRGPNRISAPSCTLLARIIRGSCRSCEVRGLAAGGGYGSFRFVHCSHGWRAADGRAGGGTGGPAPRFVRGCRRPNPPEQQRREHPSPDRPDHTPRGRPDRGCPHAHNLAVHPDSLYYYCSNEQDKTVDVFDTRTLQQIQQIPLSERPNKIVVNKSTARSMRASGKSRATVSP